MIINKNAAVCENYDRNDHARSRQQWYNRSSKVKDSQGKKFV